MLTEPVQHLCDLWGMESPDCQAIASFDLSTWSTFQTVLFLDRLLDCSPLSQSERSPPCTWTPIVFSIFFLFLWRMPSCCAQGFLNSILVHSSFLRSVDVMSLLSSCYSVLLDGMNAEVQIRWLQVVVRNGFYPDLQRVRSFLHKHVSVYIYHTEPSHNTVCDVWHKIALM